MGHVVRNHRDVHDIPIDLTWRADDQGYDQRRLIDVFRVPHQPMLAEILAVVRGYDDQRPIVETGAVQPFEQRSDLLVDITDLCVVLSDHLLDQVGWHRVLRWHHPADQLIVQGVGFGLFG